jgi:hypothetical protein
MRRLLSSVALVSALGVSTLGVSTTTFARAEPPLTAEETASLNRHETVIRPQNLERGEHRYIGGITYTVMAASTAEIAAVLDNVESLRKVLPRTKRARIVGTDSGDQLLELVQGNAVVEAEYTVRIRRGPNDARFWLDPSRPHGIDDAWGFFRYEPFIGQRGEAHVLLTYAVLADVGPGIVRDLFEERVRNALLSVPQLVRRQVAVLRRPS